MDYDVDIDGGTNFARSAVLTKRKPVEKDSRSWMEWSKDFVSAKAWQDGCKSFFRAEGPHLEKLDHDPEYFKADFSQNDVVVYDESWGEVTKKASQGTKDNVLPMTVHDLSSEDSGSSNDASDNDKKSLWKTLTSGSEEEVGY